MKTLGVPIGAQELAELTRLRLERAALLALADDLDDQAMASRAESEWQDADAREDAAARIREALDQADPA